MKLIDLLRQSGVRDPMVALLAGGAAILGMWARGTLRRRIDMERWLERGHGFDGIDMLCAVGAHHDDDSFRCGACQRVLPFEEQCAGDLCHDCGCGASLRAAFRWDA